MALYNKINVSLYISLALLLSSITVSQAADSNWHTDTKSYRVYLGVVPTSMIKQDLTLIDKDKSLHGGVHKATSSSQHVMVSIFTKKENKRVLNATVIAEIKNKKFIKKNKITKPLEKMETSGEITYGNFFNLPSKNKYAIEVEIYQPNKNGYEKAKFIYKSY